MKKNHHEQYPDPFHGTYARTVFGFWVYLLTDFILFGALFATYAVLHNSTFGGPTAKDITHPEFALWQSLILLTSALTAGLGSASAHRKDKNKTILYFSLTFLLGVLFFAMMWHDMAGLIAHGKSWKNSAFLSAYFTLIGTHAVHILFALLWIPILLVPVWKEGITHFSVRRLACLKMFWQFLNIIWVFIYSFVYLMGGIA